LLIEVNVPSNQQLIDFAINPEQTDTLDAIETNRAESSPQPAILPVKRPFKKSGNCFWPTNSSD
jgi:hypothetical protein